MISILLGFDDVITRNTDVIGFNWYHQAQQQERNLKFEKTQTCLLYHSIGGDIEHMSGTKKTKEINIDDSEFNWLAFKHQFFNASIINRNAFNYGKAKLINSKAVQVDGKDRPVPNAFEARLDLPYQAEKNYNIPLQFYFGPNDLKTLKATAPDLEEIIPLWLGSFWLGE